MTAGQRHNLRNAMLFISPWIVGFSVFVVYPVLASLYWSFCDYSVLSRAVWIGVGNYSDLMTDEVFWKVVWNTLFYTVFAIPLGTLTAFFLAVLLNTGVRGTGLYRTIFFLPSLVPLVALGILWRWIFNTNFGVLNYLLSFLSVFNFFFEPVNALLTVLGNPLGLSDLGIGPVPWLQDPAWAKPAIIIATLWTSGQAMVIYLAGLQEVPSHLYESAALDGASWYHKIRHVTVPMISPVVYFNVVMGIIWSLQIFALPYVMTSSGAAGGQQAYGGPARATLMYTMYLYDNAFRYLNMGYACSMAWILFVVTLVLTLIATAISKRHVYYAD
ncbi:MAG: sugar ABC transporter permease [bacterium]